MTRSADWILVGPPPLTVGINEDHSRENRQRLFMQSQLQQGRRPPSLGWSETQRQAEEWESFMLEKKREVSVMPWLEAATRRGHPMRFVRGTYLASSGWS